MLSHDEIMDMTKEYLSVDEVVSTLELTSEDVLDAFDDRAIAYTPEFVSKLYQLGINVGDYDV